ncbi:hypothetical protein HanIR_Chr17g0862131 [Helianthus annuus]|nr:hypothetical protein HanIR_Chr17g0862131 [Helianthus annuus]
MYQRQFMNKTPISLYKSCFLIVNMKRKEWLKRHTENVWRDPRRLRRRYEFRRRLGILRRRYKDVRNVCGDVSARGCRVVVRDGESGL